MPIEVKDLYIDIKNTKTDGCQYITYTVINFLVVSILTLSFLKNVFLKYDRIIFITFQDTFYAFSKF